MKKSSFIFLLLTICILPFQAKNYQVTSPDKALGVQITENESLSYSVSFRGKTIIEPSLLAKFEWQREPAFGDSLEVIQTATRSHNEIWTPVVKSKHAQITDKYNELTLFLQEKKSKRRKIDITFRVYDDGVAFRYKLYRNEMQGIRQITREGTEFNIPGNPDAWVVEYPYASPQESEYHKRKTDYLTEKSIAGLPLLMKYADDCWVAITEAQIDNYPAFFIGTNGNKNQFTTKLAPLPGEKEEGVKARFADEVKTPWRVIMTGNSPGTLIESEIIQNLNDPCAIADPSWIRPGLSAWDHWWSGEVKMEMPVIKEYIDFASEMGWPYMLIDWQWYGEFNKPQADICKPAPQINMPELIAYAKSKNVRLWVWLYSTDVNRNSAYKKAFPLYKEWGIAGVKIDFMDRSDQDIVNWYHDIIRCAADNHLLVDFHGAYLPDGIIRTYPNMITREGVMGNEYYKFSKKMSPEHNVQLAYTRMLNGQMDYTPGGFNNVTAKDFKNQTPTLVANTRAAELAKFVVYESPFMVMCEHPKFVLGQAGADFLKIVPSVWDNIKFLGGTPDQYVAIAKQSGKNWFIGVLNNSKEKEITLNTDFLPAGKYKVEIWGDAKDSSANPKNLKKTVLQTETGKPLKVKMAEAGGSAIVCTPESLQTDVLIQKAKPVWAAGREKEMNVNLGFRTAFQAVSESPTKVKIAASSIYRIFLNGEFLGSGPARGAHGYFRVDEYDLNNKLQAGENILAIEVAGYNINTFYTLDQPSFLLAEVETDGKIVRATGNGKDFDAFVLKERLQKTERYSFQRPFTEYYRMENGYDQWRVSSKPFAVPVKLATFPAVKLLPRRVQMPEFDIVRPVSVYSKGTVKQEKPEKYHKDRSLTQISPKLKGYTEAELETVPPSQEIQEIVNASSEIVNRPISSLGTHPLKSNEFYILDLGTNLSGFFGAKLHCTQPSRLYFYFDEMLTDGDVKTRQRMPDVCNQIVYELAPGDYNIETMESYTFKFMKIIVLEGECSIEDFYLREFSYPENKKATFVSSNFKLNAIFDAAKQSSRQNAIDVFMDCASRERAGWLCDSYYAAIMEKEFTGKSDVACNFFENYALPDSFRYLPQGMIPMCYPADFYNGEFIPNWSLWFILQVEDYARRGGDPALIARLKPRIENLLKYFEGFENEDGLLEKLQSWIFVEWSKANGFVRDVNYPTNMLYSAALKAAAQTYNSSAWAEKAERIRQTVIKQSYNGNFFIDNANRIDKKLTLTKNTTEVCQYYAFFFNIVTPTSHPELWKKLVTEFGPNRNDKIVYPDVFRANAFMGNYMRMDLLSRYGLQSQMLMEIQDYFFFMADKTGTLWEHDNNSASCNHGFASYIGHVLYRDVLGISQIDYIRKEITIRFTDIILDSCSGSIPIGDDFVGLQWKRTGDTIAYSVKAPTGFTVKIENFSTAKMLPALSAQENFHLYLLIGQSNMAGRDISKQQDTVANPRILRLNKEGVWEIAKDPLHFDKPGAGVGPGLSFAQAMLDGENNDVTIGLIPCAVGGSAIDDWKSGVFYEPTKSHPYDDALKRTRQALKNGVLKGILWHQGESDSEPEKAKVYKEKLIRLVNNLRNEFQTPDVPFLAGEIPTFQNRGTYINKVFHEAKNDIPNYEVVSAQGLTLLSDSLHLNAASQRELGKRYAGKMRAMSLKN